VCFSIRKPNGGGSHRYTRSWAVIHHRPRASRAAFVDRPRRSEGPLLVSSAGGEARICAPARGHGWLPHHLPFTCPTMRLTARSLPLFGATFLALLLPGPARSQVGDPDPNRFAEAISQFARWDRQNAAPPNGVLFVGSSSIVRWSTADRFPDLPVINRGFGGSHISDVNHFIDQTVLKYAPELVVFYAGNNDIAAGKTPAQVLEDYDEFVRKLLASRPDTRILYISIHPSPRRWSDWPSMREANTLIEAYSERQPGLHYIDISDPMLGTNGEPVPALFAEDRLHLSEAGYDLWTPIVARAIAEVRSHR
jgi:lysophospholipase L1-like esterase